ncbi:metal ABC transporter substrate-binding protein [Clostridium luticellarii]|uniref:Manganese ABC transporter substrate-binding lipoprotein n=1 Tax=Clostridium luticellarii TaxID=1691940 RepID=A0A2T0BNA3_9CLOT|nr:metal ABC transporter substrate-binding protein [Clostridium luticellarii]MCI1945435.1 metal ABC transporter substrate-binding protein [Clostridium luticellarii]MCI1968768.1 metal ABC transporter substrate-binding protein [Clostridium luticellarii]MCI1994958.1 metal ABC transporter substrate-binding protein [Clostridium luticellarii]MCI2040195.1 metal ABC transporter substrate-binding protein [Clostridium luticellarii]PRR85359.1 Manganese ABC transporter substrate-binding lipoprotein precur
MKNLKRLLSLVILFFIIFTTACSNKNYDNTNEDVNKLAARKDKELDIVTTDKLLYNMVRSITKDRHVVEYMFNNRTSEMNFKFTEDSVNNISKKDLFFYVGAGFEPWIDSFVDKLNKSRVGVTNVSRGVQFLNYNSLVKYNDTILKYNPYYFTNIDNYRIMLMNIKNALQDKDPENRDIYEKNFSDTLKSLDSYKKNLKSVDDQLSDYNFIVAEDELSYFIKYNNLNALEINPGESGSIMPTDPIARQNLDKRLKNSNTIFLYNDETVLKNNAEVLKNYNIKAVKIEIYNGDLTYEETLKYNIKNLENIYKR